MKPIRIISLSASLAIVTLVISCGSATAQKTTLFGERIDPNRPSRDQAFNDLSKLRTDRARQLFGSKNGMLAAELGSQMFSSDSYRSKAEAIDEWLTVYPHIPSGSQRFLACQALCSARLMPDRGQKPSRHFAVEVDEALIRGATSSRIIACVLQAAVANNWYRDASLDGELQALMGDPTIYKELKEQANHVLAQKQPDIDVEFDSRLSSTEKLVTSIEGHLPTETRKVDWQHHQLSWWPKVLAAITEPDGRLKEHGATTAKEVKILLFSPADSAKVVDSLNSLTYFYEKLPDSSKEIFTGRVLRVVQQLQFSNLHSQADTLLWRVAETIDPTWLEYEDIESNLGNSSPYYAQTFDLAKAVKLELKVMEIEDLHYGGIPSNDNLRLALGDLYDEMGNYKESRKQYETVKEIQQRLVRTGIVEANDYMDRDYDMRMGTYVSRYTADHPLE